MRKIKIGFSSHRGFAPFSWAIMAYEQTPYSHVYFSIDTKWKTTLIYQASGAMVNFMAGAVFMEKNKIEKEFDFEISDQAYDLFMAWATTVCGRPYSVMQIFGFLVMDLFGMKENPFSNGDKDWVCAELVGYALSDLVGVKVDPEFLEKATPMDLYNICENIKNKELTNANSENR